MGNNNTKSSNTNIEKVPIPKRKVQPTIESSSKQLDLEMFSKEDLCIIDNLGEFCEGDEINITGVDLSKCVQNAYKLFPFNTVGRVISIFPSLQINKEEDFPFGTGTIIGQRAVITSAHNLYQKNSKLRARHIFFEPECEGASKGQLIRVKRYAIHKSFFQSENKQSQGYDMAVLLLEENNVIKAEMIMPLKFDYTFAKFKQAEILISGYPKEKNTTKRFIQFYESNPALHQKQNFLLYKHYTSSGHSGSPVLMKEIDHNGDESYCQIGVHKGSTGMFNFCVLLNDEESTFVQLLKKVSIQQCNSMQQIQEQDTNILAIQEQLGKKQKSTQGTKWYIELNGIKWSRNNVQQQKVLNCYLAGNTQKIKTFKSCLQQILDAIEELTEEKCLLSLDVWAYVVQRFKYLELSVEEEKQFFKILASIVGVNMGVKQVTEALFGAEIGERLFNFWNKVYYKRSGDDEEYEDKEEVPLYGKSDKIHAGILQVIKQGFKNVDFEKRKLLKYESELRFYLSNKNIQRALITSNRKEINQQQSANVFWLKAEIMREAGYLKRALIYYTKCLQVQQKEFGIESSNYATTLNNIGFIYKNQGEYDQALQFYFKSQEIEKKLNGTFSINTVPTLNNMALIYNEKGERSKARDMMLLCLQIQKMHIGPKHIDTAITLHNIGLMYDDAKEYEKALQSYQQSLDIKQTHYGKDSVNSCSTINNIGMVYWNLKAFDKSLAYFMRCLHVQQRVHGLDSFNCVITLNNIASVFREFKFNDEALKYYKRCLGIKEKIKGKNSMECFQTMKVIAGIYFEEEEYAEAIQYYKRCLEVQTGLNGAKKGYATICEKLAEVYIKNNQIKLANDNATLCYQIRYKMLGKNHELTNRAYKLVKKTK